MIQSAYSDTYLVILANFNELGPGVWHDPHAISMTLQEGRIFTPKGSMPSHIYCYDKRLFAAMGAAIGSAPAYRPDNASQFDDFVDTLAPFESSQAISRCNQPFACESWVRFDRLLTITGTGGYGAT